VQGNLDNEAHRRVARLRRDENLGRRSGQKTMLKGGSYGQGRGRSRKGGSGNSFRGLPVKGRYQGIVRAKRPFREKKKGFDGGEGGRPKEGAPEVSCMGDPNSGLRTPHSKRKEETAAGKKCN